MADYNGRESRRESRISNLGNLFQEGRTSAMRKQKAFILLRLLLLIAIIIISFLRGCSGEPREDKAEASESKSVALSQKTMHLNIDDKTSIDLVYIEPGSFIMGRDIGWGEKIFALISYYFIIEKYPDEGPSRKVKITKGFYIGKYEVTTRQFCKFLNAVPNPQDYVQLNKFARIEIKDEAYIPKPGWENCQISVVHWRGAVAFCQWLSRRTGLTVRLPTEAEWEYVARSPISKRYPWGETGEDPNKLSTREAHGVIGMPGWIGEWCSDFYGTRYLKDDLINPQGPREEDLPVGSGSFLIGPIEGKYRVLRRGRSVRSRTFGDEVGDDAGIYGFRIVVMPPE